MENKTSNSMAGLSRHPAAYNSQQGSKATLTLADFEDNIQQMESGAKEGK